MSPMRLAIDDWGDGLGRTGGGLPILAQKKWLDINWVYSHSGPDNWEVVVFTGADPTAADKWLQPILKAPADQRRLVTAIRPDTSLTNINAAVRGVFGGSPGPWTVTASGSNTTAVTTGLGLKVDTDTALATLAGIASDSILSKGEKPSIITEYQAAVNDYALLTGKAVSAGVPYAAYAAAFTALQTYLLGLAPAYNNVTQDTTIVAADWQTTWQAYYKASTALLVQLAGAPPSSADLIATADVANLTTNAAAPTVDGVTVVDQQLVLLPSQSTPAQNGVYRVAYTAAQGAAVLTYPNAVAYSVVSGAPGSHSNDANAWDGTTSVPNDATAARLEANASANSTVQETFSGWTGTSLSGTLTVKIEPQSQWIEQPDLTMASGTITVSYSTDGGATFTSMGSFNGDQYGALQTLTASLSGVTGSNIRVKVTAKTTVPLYENPTPPPFMLGGTAAQGLVDIASVFLSVPSGAANYAFNLVQPVLDGTLWRARGGTSNGGKIFLASVDTSNNVTLTTQAYDSATYDLNFPIPGKPPAGAKYTYPATRPFTIQAQGHLGSAGTANTTNPADFLVKKNGSTFGTLRFGAAGAFSLVSFAAANFATGDVLTIVAPAPQDATLADIGFTLRGNL